jgi:hypothetical protein
MQWSHCEWSGCTVSRVRLNSFLYFRRYCRGAFWRISSSSLSSSFFLASDNALSRACNSVLVCMMMRLMCTRSPLTCLWLYWGGTGDFALLNLTFFLGSGSVFSLFSFCCAGDFVIGSVGASMPSLPSPWPSYNSWVTSLSQSISFVFQLISGLYCCNYWYPSIISHLSIFIMSNLTLVVRSATISGR